MGIEIVQCDTLNEVNEAKGGFIVELAKLNGDHSGELQMAKDFVNGVGEMFFSSPMFKKKHKFYYAKVESGAVVGLLRLEIQPDRVHIAQVTGIPRKGAGNVLVNHAKSVAKQHGKGKVDLSTADTALPAYYSEKHGFKMVTEGAKTGAMEFVIE